MNYFSKIKPVLNKISELNVYDSLFVVRAYMQACASGSTNKKNITGVRNSVANSVEVWFADFLIVNIIKYCDNLPSVKSLRDVNTRYFICNKIQKLHEEVSRKLIDQEVFIWLNSYFFNQVKITFQENVLLLLYRYYYLYNSASIRTYAEQKMNLPLDLYFKMSFYVYVAFFDKNRFFVKEDYFLLSGLPRMNLNL